MLEIAQKNVKGVDFKIMDVRDILALDGKFDAIMSSFCFPFLSKVDTSKLIADCAQKLHKNGVMYISTMEGDESQAGFERTSFSGESEIYFNYHWKKDLEKKLIDNGFNIEYNLSQEYIDPRDGVLTDLIIIAKISK
jgi:2-polyprenyl-3-methyl-5-hydroxy-6-metoxy-1,4-benzoquinol methylase